VQVDASALADRERFGRGGADGLRDEVVQQLDRVAGAGRADVDHVLGEAAQHRFELRKRRVARADHHVELAELGFDRRARERRVDEGHALRGGEIAQPRGRIGLARRAVDDHEAGLGCAPRAIRARRARSPPLAASR